MRVIPFEHDTETLGAAVVAIGVFDGVHLGHQALISATVEDAVARSCAAAVVTFDRDPDQVVTPETAAPQLLTLEEKCVFIAAAGAETILVVPFDATIASMPPGTFVDTVLMRALSPVTVHVGVDFRFGHFAEGDLTSLEELGAERGFDVVGHDLVTQGGAPVTSTRIRALVASGNVSAAAALLGREHRVSGRVVHGRGEGVPLLGIPTANIAPHRFAALPAEGVYSGTVTIEGRVYPAGISVGIPPTFPEARDELEAHLIGFDGDLYGREVTVAFVDRLRSQRPFDTAQELADAIRTDIDAVRVALADGDRP